MALPTDQDKLRDAALDLVPRLMSSPRTVAVRLWDGTVLPSDVDPPRATLVLNDPDVLASILVPPIDLAAGEAFLHGDLEVEGDLESAIAAIDGAGADGSPLQRIRAAMDVVALRRRAAARRSEAAATLRGRRHGKRRDRSAIRHHYDLPAEFYRLWLDRRMVYSCGTYPTGDETLDEAQAAKLELICRKLRLRPEHRFLDIGCGWGGLVVYAAERHSVRARGVTLAPEQVAEGRRRIEAAGLTGRAEVEERDYRDLRERFDRIASVGMAEHVGRENLESYFRSVWDRLEPGGLMLNHAISRGPSRTDGSGDVLTGAFIQRYVFPDGEIVELPEVLRAAESVGFEVRDVEDLREHYARTLRHWVAGLEANWEAAVDLVGLERARIWRLYMSGSAHQFAHGRLAVHQTLLAKPDADGRVDLPGSRADLYAS